VSGPLEFVAVREPGLALLEEAAALSPTNPFATPAYVEARRGFDGEPWVLGVLGEGRLSAACLAHLRTGRLTRSLEIVSLPALPATDVFWRGLRELCGAHRIDTLQVNTYGSITAAIPRLPAQAVRAGRCEYVLNLRSGDLAAGLSGDHRRNIARACKKGLTVRRTTDPEACVAHTSMLLASMERRQHRGERVPAEFRHQEFLAMLATGAGELFQATADGEVVSSVLLLRARRGAYSQTMGTNATGMKCGGARLVVFEAARMLANEGLEILNLGGISEENPGLREFKLGFGARAVELEAVEFSFATAFKRSVVEAARLLRSAIQTTRRAFDHDPSRDEGQRPGATV
jgi:Acetyltransferase (GNAT) domain